MVAKNEEKIEPVRVYVNININIKTTLIGTNREPLRVMQFNTIHEKDYYSIFF
jgi:hypothetical protein